MTTTVDNHPAIEILRDKFAAEELDSATKADLGEIEMKVTTGYTLADAIREGSSVTDQAVGSFIQGESVCALSAGYLAAKARGYLS